MSLGNCRKDSLKILCSNPQRGVINHIWIISDFNILRDNLKIQLESPHFNSSLSLTYWHLLAEVQDQNLVITLKESINSGGYVFGKYKFWATETSLSLPEINPPITQVGNDQQLGGSNKLCVKVPIQSLPTRGPIKVKFTSTITSNLCLHNYISKPDASNLNPLHKMEFILNNEKFWDTEISAGEKKFKVHKAILASVSEVFYKMFESEMLEKTTGVVKISDIDSAVMSDLLTYAYTGIAPHKEQHVKELLIAADKYCMESLTNTCIEYLESTMSSENVAEILLLADSIPTGTQLKSKCINYIRTNFSTVSETQPWLMLGNSSKKLAMECMQLFPIQTSASAFKKKELSYIWIVNECKDLHQVKAIIKGRQIITKKFPYPLYLNMYFTEDAIEVRLEGDHKAIKLSDKSHLNVWACDCSFRVLDRNDELPCVTVQGECNQLIKTETSTTYFNNKISTNYVNCLTTTILDNDDLDDYLCDGSLCIQVNVNVVNINRYVQSEEVSDIPLTAISHGSLLENEWFSDVTIQVQDSKFNVHKVMLASASEVFQHQFENSKSNVLQVDGITPAIMSQMLTYIYTGKIPKIEVNTTQLLVAADRCRIPGLVGKCIYELQLKFTSRNIAETLSYADQLYYSDSIKTSCIDFIKYNSVSVFQSNSWKSLTESSMALAFEVMQETLRTPLANTAEI